jgi:hypothetical protein
MQVVFCGYGTGWHWCYYLPLTVHTLDSIVLLYSLRYPPAIWHEFRPVQAWSVMIVLSIYIEILLPIPGFVTNRMLHLVPFRSPTYVLVYSYIIVWHSPFSVCLSVHAKMWLCLFHSCENIVETLIWWHIWVAQTLVGCYAAPSHSIGRPSAHSFLCMVVACPQINMQHVWHQLCLLDQRCILC